MHRSDQLTPREYEVLMWLARGATNRMIATKLMIQASTVEQHLVRIYSKLSVPNRTMAVLVALDTKLLPQDTRNPT